MADRYIITDRRFMQHVTLDDAIHEKARLETLLGNSEKKFRIIRVKTNLERGNAFPFMVDALIVARAVLSQPSLTEDERNSALDCVKFALSKIRGKKE